MDLRFNVGYRTAGHKTDYNLLAGENKNINCSTYGK